MSKSVKQTRIVTLQDWFNLATKACSPQNPTAPHQIASKVFKLSRTQLIQIAPTKKLTRTNLAKLNNLLGRLLAGRPLAQVVGRTNFYNLSFKVNSKVLSPRAETEELVDYATKHLPKNAKAIDIGCGSGAIGLSLAKARPDLTVTLSDISVKALSLARNNTTRGGLKTNILEFKRSSLIKKFVQSDLENSFFLANLPYVSKNWDKLNKKSLKHEPNISLFASNNGIQAIQNLIISLNSRSLLHSKNWLLIEHDPKQLTDLKSLCKKEDLEIEVISDYVSKVFKVTKK